jgi:hypothetical protein
VGNPHKKCTGKATEINNWKPLRESFVRKKRHIFIVKPSDAAPVKYQ